MAHFLLSSLSLYYLTGAIFKIPQIQTSFLNNSSSDWEFSTNLSVTYSRIREHKIRPFVPLPKKFEAIPTFVMAITNSKQWHIPMRKPVSLNHYAFDNSVLCFVGNLYLI